MYSTIYVAYHIYFIKFPNLEIKINQIIKLNIITQLVFKLLFHVLYLLRMEENKCRTKGQKPCGPTKGKKNVVDLIKMVKKNVGPQRGQKNKKGNEFLHCTICEPQIVVNKLLSFNSITFLKYNDLNLYKLPSSDC